MKNQAHPEFKGTRRSRKDDATMSRKSRVMMRKGSGKRGATGTHSKFLVG